MKKIEINAIIDAEQAKVWEYYTAPEHIINWNFASDEWCCPSAENDMRVGGTYKARMEARDGSMGFDFEAVYSNVELGDSFEYGLGGRQVKVDFKGNKDTTEITVIFDPESENPIEMQRSGWQAILNNFKKYAEQQ